MKQVLLLLSFFSLAIAPIAQSQNTPGQPPVVYEIGIAVNNIQQATLHYNELMGLNQWRYSDFYAMSDEQPFPIIRMAKAQFGDKHIALLQPLSTDIKLSEHLAKYGQSIFHVGVIGDVEKLNKYEQFVIQDSNDVQAKLYASYDELGINIVTYDKPAELSVWGTTDLPESDAINDFPIFQLGIISNDLSDNAMSYLNTLGIGPWLVVDFKGDHLSNGQYLGAKGSVKPHIKVAYAMWGNLQLELLMPVSGPSPHRDHLISKGFGAHHLSYGPIGEHDKLVEQLTAKNIVIQMQSDNGGAGRTATYMDTIDQLGFVLEFTRNFKGPGTLPVAGTIPARQ